MRGHRPGRCDLTSQLETSRWYQRDRRRFSKPLGLLPACRPPASGTWADLGCGDGIFSAVLADLLGPFGRVVGLDRDRHALSRFDRNMAAAGMGGETTAVLADFRQPLPLAQVDGLLAANALHFTRQAEKAPLLSALTQRLRPGGQWIIVEYNHELGTGAVPHPLAADGWVRLLHSLGLQDVRVAARVPSRYLGEMVAVSGIKPGRQAGPTPIR
jgi:SAM-dependent methyltransferase